MATNSRLSLSLSIQDEKRRAAPRRSVAGLPPEKTADEPLTAVQYRTGIVSTITSPSASKTRLSADDARHASPSSRRGSGSSKRNCRNDAWRVSSAILNSGSGVSPMPPATTRTHCRTAASVIWRRLFRYQPAGITAPVRPPPPLLPSFASGRKPSLATRVSCYRYTSISGRSGRHAADR